MGGARCFRVVFIRLINATTIFVSEWHTNSLRRGRFGAAGFGVVHAKGAVRYVEEFRDAGMSLELAEAL